MLAHVIEVTLVIFCCIAGIGWMRSCSRCRELESAIEANDVICQLMDYLTAAPSAHDVSYEGWPGERLRISFMAGGLRYILTPPSDKKDSSFSFRLEAYRLDKFHPEPYWTHEEHLGKWGRLSGLYLCLADHLRTKELSEPSENEG